MICRPAANSTCNDCDTNTNSQSLSWDARGRADHGHGRQQRDRDERLRRRRQPDHPAGRDWHHALPAEPGDPQAGHGHHRHSLLHPRRHDLRLPEGFLRDHRPDLAAHRPPGHPADRRQRRYAELDDPPADPYGSTCGATTAWVNEKGLRRRRRRSQPRGQHRRSPVRPATGPIARRAGVGAGTVYRHFPTKEALYEAILLDHVERLTAEATLRPQSPEQPGEAFFDFLSGMVQKGGGNRALAEAVRRFSLPRAN